MRAEGSCGGLISVADAPHGEDAPGNGGVFFDLLPQPAYVDGHGGGVPELPAPDLLQQFGPGERLPRVPHEERQEIELAGGQRDAVVAEPYLVRGRVDG